jgi:hypothetical protein
MFEIAPGVRVAVFGFAASFLSVGLINGRFFLRDCYHRAFGLLDAGGVMPATCTDREAMSMKNRM